MVRPLEFQGMNYRDLCEKLLLTDDEFENWMKSQGLIHRSMTCNNCQEPMHDRKLGRNRYWICEKGTCRHGPNDKTKPNKGFFKVCFPLLCVHFAYYILGHFFLE